MSLIFYQQGWNNLSHLVCLHSVSSTPLDCTSSQSLSLSLGRLIHILKMSLLCWGGCFTPNVAITFTHTAADRKEQVWCLHILTSISQKPSIVVQISLIPTLSRVSQMCFWEIVSAPDAREIDLMLLLKYPLYFLALFSLCSGLTHPDNLSTMS